MGFRNQKGGYAVFAMARFLACRISIAWGVPVSLYPQGQK